MFLKLFALSLPIFLGIDMVWLGVVSRGFYKQNLGFLMRSDVNWFAAGSFYIIFVAALVALVVQPALEKNSLSHALLYGAIFGFASYATYDLTNFATIKNWPLTVTLVDLVWGAVLACIVAGATFYCAKKLGL